MWAKKFISAGATRGYADLLSGDVVAPAHDEELDPDSEEDQMKIKAREANKKAYNDLILACEGETSFNIVDEAYSDRLPKGDARMAWEKLERKFMPDTSAHKVKLKGRFTQNVLKHWKKDPDDWFTSLETMRTRLYKMNHSISDEDLMIHIVHNLPKEYDDCIMEWERRIGNPRDPLTVDDLRDELGLKYDMILKRKNIRVKDEFDISDDGSDEEGQETALIAKAYKGRCYNCGNFGHKKANCPNKKKNQGTKNDNQCGGAAFQKANATHVASGATEKQIVGTTTKATRQMLVKRLMTRTLSCSFSIVKQSRKFWKNVRNTLSKRRLEMKRLMKKIAKAM